MEIDILKTTDDLAKILLTQSERTLRDLTVTLEFDRHTFEDIDRQLHVLYWESGLKDREKIKKINRDTFHLTRSDILFVLKRKPRKSERITFIKDHGSFY